jgi:glycerol kinase
MPYILALDEGTTSARAIVFDDAGAIRATAQREFTQHYPQPGWVAHDPNEIWTAQLAVTVEALRSAKLQPRDIAAVGITNQRETTVVWDRLSGEPITNAIVWQDRRTAPMCEKLLADGYEPTIRTKTGLVLDAYFSASKIAWILDHIPKARQRAEAGQLAFGTIDSWLIWKLTGGALHVTDPSNASRTMLFNIHSQEWDEELLQLFRIPHELLPAVEPSSAKLEAITVAELEGIPIAGIAGDQQAALFGQACTEPGLTKNTYGTGCFLLQCTGDRPVESQHRLITTAACSPSGRPSYALEGSVFVGGAVVQWLRDGLGLIKTADEVNALAASTPDSGGIVLVPAFVGLGAPHWDPQARGIIVGITRGTTAGHLARAGLEAIAFQSAELLDAMRADAEQQVTELRVDGGASRSDLLMQLQADLLGIPVVRPAVTETTALGAAYLAGLAVGVWKSSTEIETQRRIDRTFEPTMPREQAGSMRANWQKAVERAKNWAS